MKLQFAALSEQGKRANNEDNYYPRPEDEKPVKDLYMVCDGVGGAEKGEVASKIACSAIAHYFKRNKNEEIDDIFIQSSIVQAEAGMRTYIEHNPESRGMATTLTLLYFDKEQAVVAHCGDSRVYQIRDGEILHKTFDHSLVNELLASGAIKDEEAARNHPRKNVITRALSGGKEHTEADVTFITDVKKNDCFLLCSDGVLESVDDAKIKQLFVKENSAEFICNEIKELCDGHSNDNFTAIIIKTEQGIVTTKTPAVVATSETVVVEKDTEIIQPTVEETNDDVIIIKEEVQENYEKKSNKPIKYIILFGVLVILAFAGYRYGKHLLKLDKKDKTEITAPKDEQQPTKNIEKGRIENESENEVKTGSENTKPSETTNTDNGAKVKDNKNNENSTNDDIKKVKSNDVIKSINNTKPQQSRTISSQSTQTLADKIKSLEKEIHEIQAQLKDSTIKDRTRLTTILAIKNAELKELKPVE